MPTAPTNNEWVTISGKQYRCVEGTYSYVDSQYFSIPYRLGDPSFETFVPETVTDWVTWHRGFGDLYYKDPEAYYTTTGIDASIVNQMTLGLAAATTYQSGAASGATIGETITNFVDFLGKTYAFGNTKAWVWDPTTSPSGWTLSKSFGFGPLGQPAVYSITNGAATPGVGRYLSVPVGTATQAFFDGTTWLGVGTSIAHLQAIRNELWKAYFDSNNTWQLAKSVDGVTYAASNMIGDGTATVNSMFSYSNQLFLNTTDGIESVDNTGKFWDILPEVGLYADPTLGQGANVFHDVAYIPTNRGLLQFTGSSSLSVTAGSTTLSYGPDVKSTSQSGVRGKIRYVAPHINYAYMTFNTFDNHGVILKFRDYPDTQPGQGFHPIWTGASTGVMGAAKVSTYPWYGGAAYPILWFSYNNDIYHMDLPLVNDNPLANAGMQYQTSATIDLPIISDNMPSVPKYPIRFYADLTATTNTTLAMYLSLDNGTFNLVASATGTQGVISFDVATNQVQYNTAQIRVQMSTTNPLATPVLRSLQYHHLIRPYFLRQWQMQLLLQSDSLRQTPETTKGQLSDLEAARKSVAPFTYIDKMNYAWVVTMEKLNTQETIKEPDNEPTLVASVTLLDRNITGFYVGNNNAIVGQAIVAA